MISGNISRTEKITYQGKVRNEKKTNYFILLFITIMKKSDKVKIHEQGKITLQDVRTVKMILNKIILDEDKLTFDKVKSIIHVHWLLKAIENMFTSDEESEINIRGFRD